MSNGRLKTACLASVMTVALSAGSMLTAPVLAAPALMDGHKTTAPSATITRDGDTYKLTQTIPSFSDFILIETQMGKIAPRVVTVDQMADDLAGYDVVFVGEAHGHVASHLVQSKLFAGLYARGKNLSLSMEQFERSAQPIMDQYLAGEIGEQALRDKGKAWDHYTSSYRPMVELAKREGLPVIAAEVPGNMVSCVGEEGPAFLDRLTGEPRTWIADKLHLDDGPYKTRYFDFMARAAGHNVSDADMTEAEKEEKRFRSFAAQVSRDDTMAESIYLHLQKNPGRKVMHIDGSFHSAALLGTVERLKIRMPELKLANVHPILVEDPNNVTFDASMVGEGHYIVLLQPVPRRFVKMSNINEFIKKTRSKIDENRCAY